MAVFFPLIFPQEPMMRNRLLRDRSLPCVALGRDKEFYVFRYRKGREAEFISTLVEYAENDDLSFSWRDLLLILRHMRL